MIEGSDAVWVDVIELAAIAAGPVARQFHRWVEFEDMKQSACEYAFKRQDKIHEYLYEQDEDGKFTRREDKDTRRQGETAMITFLRRHCERTARREKAIQLGYNAEDEYFYRPVIVEGLIKVWGSGEYDVAGQVLDPAELGGRRKKVASEGNDFLAMISDIDAAMKRIDQRTRTILVDRFVHEMTLQDIATQLDISLQRVDQLVDKGLRLVVDELGGKNPY